MFPLLYSRRTTYLLQTLQKMGVIGTRPHAELHVPARGSAKGVAPCLSQSAGCKEIADRKEGQAGKVHTDDMTLLSAISGRPRRRPLAG